ncbi:MAG: restriction endonuclease [Alphaproteobacteria bacterium]|nr:restriction endonuclease [Alphaproteobacteria bacterium]
MPSINQIQYIKAHDKFEGKEISETERKKLYDSCIYQISLRVLHELFKADTVDVISSINFNGIVETINPATGNKESPCIVSLHAQKQEFNAINLAGIIEAETYKECFKALKGVSASQLSKMVAIQPIMQFDKSDKRFIDHQAVADNLAEDNNIATMDWQDFEHLVTEIFGKEFASNGGEVKVTKASADGGVDAIAFDPDPLRGGKIVIQAKRYTNTVSVSAVRELHGTVESEGAIKGILVTTSDYGPDSYDYIKGKRLELLNGSNLLHLLEKHGHKAYIDIKEAKKINSQLS